MTRIVEVSLFVTLLVSSVVRQTANGPVKGIEQTSPLGQKYYSFRGIPFAEPPITGKDPYTGEDVDRRFKAPIPLNRTWTEALEVHNFASYCIPFNNNKSIISSKTSEDCLFLNIYVPVGGAERKTVLLWIYGGGFVGGNSGDSTYGPEFLLSEDNIVVTIQYRVGIFGFMNLGVDEYSGNMGLKDQQLALKYVYENIENFSGNKNEILLFGESAGAASVGFHLLNEESSKYFKRAYLSSSSAFSNYALVKANHLQRMKEFVRINNTDELIAYLKTADANYLSTGYQYDTSKTLAFPSVPTIESRTAVDAFMTKNPDEIYNAQKASVKDTMFSFNSKEIISFRPNYIGKTDPLIAENWQEEDVEILFEGFNIKDHPKEYKQSLEMLKEVYYSDPTNSSAVEQANIDLMSDLMFCDSILKAVILQANANNDGDTKANTFLFRFSMDVGINRNKVFNGAKFEGATHSDDLCYYFYCHEFDKAKIYDKHLEQKDATYDAIMRMVKFITNFAKTGNPSLKNDTPFKSITSNKIFCQEVSNDTISSVTSNIKEQLHFDTWRKIENIYKNIKSW